MSAARIAVCSLSLLACSDAPAPSGPFDAATIDAHDAVAIDVVAVNTGGDDPAYVQAMFDFMTSRPTFLESFWDSDDGNTKSQMTTGEDPNAGAKFLQTFGAYAKSCR